MSQLTQLILVFLILVSVMVWIIYNLFRKDNRGGCHCGHCAESKKCKAKDVLDLYQRNHDCDSKSQKKSEK